MKSNTVYVILMVILMILMQCSFHISLVTDSIAMAILSFISTVMLLVVTWLYY